MLITAASGGAGLGAIQLVLVRLLGSTVLAMTRSASKEQPLLDAGAHHLIVTGNENLAARVKEITGDMGADVIFIPLLEDHFRHSPRPWLGGAELSWR